MKKEITLNIIGGYLLFTVGAVLVLVSFSFVFSSLRATLLHKKARLESKPYLKSAKIDYYKEILTLTSRAIRLTEGSANAHRRKALYLSWVVADGLGRELFIDETDIERLYLRAIELEPLDYLYHYRLGRFYGGQDQFDKAEKELMKARELAPKKNEIRLYLAKNHLRRIKKEFIGKGEWEIFKMLLQAMHLSSWKFLGQIREIVKEFPSISWDNRKQQLIYTAGLGSDKYDFKEKKFPHEKIPVIVRLYLK
ncbi:MAG: hypothetical protein JSV34_06510, partial [Candidatus Omnitrophota bacterium]